MSHRVVLIPGDGIGPEVTDAGRRVLDASGAAIEWVVEEAGAELSDRTGVALPERTLESIRECGVALKGPITSRVDEPGGSINVALRRELDLYVGIRPCHNFAGVGTAVGDIDLVVVRMTGEDLYAGIGYDRDDPAADSLRDLIRTTDGVDLSDDTGISIRPLSLSGARRVARAAFAYARENNRKRVTAVHKATVMQETDGLFLAAARAEAADHAGIAFDDVLVDTCCGELVRRPGEYDVLLLPVFYGDIVSDLCAALIGGPGLAPGVSLGSDCAVFEAAHGSVPKYTGMQRANPLGVVLSGAMLLRHLGEAEAAARVEQAVAALLREGAVLPRDLCGEGARAASTATVADALVRELSDGGVAGAVGKRRARIKRPTARMGTDLPSPMPDSTDSAADRFMRSRPVAEPSATVRLSSEQLHDLLKACFGGVGLSSADAAVAADVLVDANLRGVDSHGVERAPVYMRRLHEGLARGTEAVSVVAQDGAMARIDAGRALGPVVSVQATDMAVDLARRHGIGLVAVGGSSHFGHAGFYARRAARHELIAAILSNAAHSMAPHGSAEAFLGANPLAVGVPLGGRGEFVLDMSTSIVARGAIRRAQAVGETLPAGIALDSEGEPTTNPVAALAGSVLPIAGPKGTGLALALGLVAGMLAGADFDDEIASMYGAAPSSVAPSIGHVMLTVDPWRLSDRESTLRRLEALVDRLHALRPSDPGEPVRYAGERAEATRRQRLREGIEVRVGELEALARACVECGLAEQADRARRLAGTGVE